MGFMKVNSLIVYGAATIPLVVLFLVTKPSSGFHIAPTGEQSTIPIANKKPLRREIFHKVLEKMGKTVLRPGAMIASRKLHASAKLTPSDHVLELASGLGRTGIEIATRYGCEYVVLSDIDEDRLVKAQAEIEHLGLADRVVTKKVDMFHLSEHYDELAASLIPKKDRDGGRLGNKDNQEVAKQNHQKQPLFDCVIAEATLTHFPLNRKSDFFTSVSEVVSPKQILLHEICFRTDSPEISKKIRHDVSYVLNTGFFPETRETYETILANAGYELVDVECGPLRVLNPWYVLVDEGLNTAKILWNLLTKKDIINRVVETRKVLDENKDNLGFITIRAVRK